METSTLVVWAPRPGFACSGAEAEAAVEPTAATAVTSTATIAATAAVATAAAAVVVYADVPVFDTKVMMSSMNSSVIKIRITSSASSL